PALKRLVVGGSTPSLATINIRSGPDTWVNLCVRYKLLPMCRVAHNWSIESVICRERTLEIKFCLYASVLSLKLACKSQVPNWIRNGRAQPKKAWHQSTILQFRNRIDRQL